MRVIAGQRKGHPLKAVPGNNTRPTTDKIKESLFSMIGPFFDGGKVLDLFAGSGGLGIEALSRGMDQAIFIDQAAPAIKTIHENLRSTRLLEQAEVYRNDAFRALKLLAKNEHQFDLVLLDPPYKKQELEKLMLQLSELGLLRPACLVVCEHDKTVELPERVGSLRKIKAPTYGITVLSIYELEEESE
ncbi:16S rRNA (guanine(966)-N(2))-methyltransferase RsmD [Listeria ilorinensis]|uniref:16S rRNA (guanine(966)-N(2))-methyltransferase RsmD n=1 Tax=Listeria ilorinensis TaxID=2867439 RepID=UPI001EF6C470|nr:16S rRNA (guanine(966)-N(2))-methyltransferase RsmD [Listeria ilorinensis]